MAESNPQQSNTANNNVESRDSEEVEDAVFAHATPSKKTYESISSDVSVESAIGELTDNALDAAALHGFDAAKIEIEREQEDGEEVLVVRDACGGVRKEEMGVFMGLGRSRDERADEQNVGTFGMGAKRALRRCGREFTITSQHLDAEHAWSYTVPAEWFEVDEEDPSEWKFEMEQTELEDPWSTELRIYDLEFDWESRVEDLRDWVATTYQKFLQEESNVDLDLDISIDGQTVSAPDPVEWSYAPWVGGLHPHRFTGLVFTEHNGEGEVQAQVTVGLLREGDAERCGTFVFCQNRLVEGNLKDETGGFGLSGGLPKFTLSQHKRLRIEIELYGDASDLPWSADKSYLRPSHPILAASPNRGVYWWLKRMADRHMRAGKYGVFGDFVKSEPVFAPYGAGTGIVANNGEIEVIDVGDKQRRLRRGEVGHVRIMEKPSNDYEAINRLGEAAYVHARLGVVAENMDDIEIPDALGELGAAHYADWCRPTYEYMVGWHFVEAYYDKDEEEFQGNRGKQLLQVGDPETFIQSLVDEKDWTRIARHLAPVTEVPTIDEWDLDDDNEDDVDTLLAEIDEVALDSVDDESDRVNEPEWAVPYYQAALTAYAAEQEIDVGNFEDSGDPILIEDDATGRYVDPVDGFGTDEGERIEDERVEDEEGGGTQGTLPGEVGDGKTTTEEGDDSEVGPRFEEVDDGRDEEETEAEDDDADGDISFREFCRQNRELLDGIDGETLDEDLDELVEQVREQLNDGLTFRRIRYSDEVPSETEAE